MIALVVLMSWHALCKDNSVQGLKRRNGKCLRKFLIEFQIGISQFNQLYDKFIFCKPKLLLIANYQLVMMTNFQLSFCELDCQWLFHYLMYLLKMLLKLKCRRFKKKNNWKKYFMILIPNPNPKLGIPTMEFQIMNFKSFIV